VPAGPADGPRVTVCRGCCCGTARKHPEVDHAGLLARLTGGVGATGTVRTSECLGPCAESNVVVVGPSAAARRVGGRPVWLSGVLDVLVIDAVCAWVRAGGPGVVEPPRHLDAAVFARPHLLT
jgi:hypothetical protein